MANKQQVLLKITAEQEKILNNLIGLMGATKAEVARNIIIVWLSEKEIITDIIRKKGNKHA